jgi:hypothetical protein
MKRPSHLACQIFGVLLAFATIVSTGVNASLAQPSPCNPKVQRCS